MSIQALARELYQAQQKLTELQKKHDLGTPEEQEALTRELALARKELHLLRRILDGEKQSGLVRQKFSGFGSFKRS